MIKLLVAILFIFATCSQSMAGVFGFGEKMLTTSVDTATKDKNGSRLPKNLRVLADVLNSGIKDVTTKLDKEKGLLTISFNYQIVWGRTTRGSGTAFSQPFPLLIRVFDRTGHPVAFFNTREIFIPEDVVKKVVETKTRVLSWCQQGECTSKLFKSQLKTGKNTLQYTIDAKAADYAESAEIGFAASGLIETDEIWRP